MLASDAYETVYCKTCGTIATTVAIEGGYACRLCGTDGNFGRLTIPYVYKYLTHLLNGMGMFMNFKLATEDEYRNLRNIQTLREEEVEATGAEELQKIEEEEKAAAEAAEEEEEEDILGTLRGKELRETKFNVEEEFQEMRDYYDNEYDDN